MLDFLKNARTYELINNLNQAINLQINAGIITEEDIKKIIELINDAKRLRRALKFL